MAGQAAVNGQEGHPPHFVVVPYMEQGHMIPMVDIALLLAERGVTVSVITTPLNAARIRPLIDGAEAAGLPARFVELPFPCAEAGLPEGCENLDQIDSLELTIRFFEGTSLLRGPLVGHLREQRHPPSCIISDMYHPWTQRVADEFGIPRFIFYGPSCFVLLSVNNVIIHKVYESLADDTTPFEVPGLPHRIEVTRSQMPDFVQDAGMEKLWTDIVDADTAAYGVVLNSFDELEPLYIESYQKVIEKKAWAIGPVSLYNDKKTADRAARGNRASVDSHQCLSWLDSMKPQSVIYVSFGSITHVSPAQLIEIGMGLEASNQFFIWVIKTGEQSPEVDKWLAEFEERTKERSVIIKGWAPQVAILSHPAVGGFITHCGWNSSLEAISAGVPVVTWPQIHDQFLNERLMVDVLGIGVSVGVKTQAMWRSEEEGELVKRDVIEAAVKELMDGGRQAEERRERARELGQKAKKAMEVGGSSHENMTRLILDVSSFRAGGKSAVEEH